MARTGKVILAKNIRMDKNYNSVLAYSESDMFNLINNNAVSKIEDCSFIRESNSIEIGLSYRTCQNANYLAFQNTTYTDKWFFAFIDRIEYISNAVTRIYYTIDIWSTWFDYWSKNDCYVIRQHSNTDVAGDNLVPEGLEHGEYTIKEVKSDGNWSGYYYMIVASISLNDLTNSNPQTFFGSMLINGACYVCDNNGVQSVINQVLSTVSPQQGTILDAYVIPSRLVSGYADLSEVTYQEITGFNPYYNGWFEIFNHKPTQLADNFTPDNKKLLTYPYQYILASNNVGDSAVWRLEDFFPYDDGVNPPTDSIVVNYNGVPTEGCSILARPINYRNSNASPLIESLIGAKFPTLAWREDSFTNWLTQNAVNNQQKALASGGSMVAGTALIAVGAFTGGSTFLAGAALLGSGIMSAADSSMEYYQHSIEPDQVKGLVSAGDLLTARNLLTYTYYHMTIKSDYATKIDKYFTRYGYRQNSVQELLFGSSSNRRRYNYIQVSNDSVAVSPLVKNNIIINSIDLETINNIFRKGVTIFKNHNEINKFELSNELV